MLTRLPHFPSKSQLKTQIYECQNHRRERDHPRLTEEEIKTSQNQELTEKEGGRGREGR